MASRNTRHPSYREAHGALLRVAAGVNELASVNGVGYFNTVRVLCSVVEAIVAGSEEGMALRDMPDAWYEDAVMEVHDAAMVVFYDCVPRCMDKSARDWLGSDDLRTLDRVNYLTYKDDVAWSDLRAICSAVLAVVHDNGEHEAELRARCTEILGLV